MTPTEQTKEKILTIPSLKFFNDGWNILLKFLKSKGNPKWKMSGDLDLWFAPIKSLENLQSVGGNLNLTSCPIESLGNLTSVGGSLVLLYTQIESLGNLTSVGGDLIYTPLSKTISEEDIRSKVNIKGNIYLQ